MSRALGSGERGTALLEAPAALEGNGPTFQGCGERCWHLSDQGVSVSGSVAATWLTSESARESHSLWLSGRHVLTRCWHLSGPGAMQSQGYLSHKKTPASEDKGPYALTPNTVELIHTLGRWTATREGLSTCKSSRISGSSTEPCKSSSIYGSSTGLPPS